MNPQFKAGKHGSCDIMIRVVECTELWFLVLIRTSSAFNKQHKVECSIEKMSLDGTDYQLAVCKVEYKACRFV